MKIRIIILLYLVVSFNIFTFIFPLFITLDSFILIFFFFYRLVLFYDS